MEFYSNKSQPKRQYDYFSQFFLPHSFSEIPTNKSTTTTPMSNSYHDTHNSTFGARSEEIRKTLRDELILPATNPRVAHWLFSNRSDNFHPDAPLLPPNSFHRAVALSIHHSYSTSKGSILMPISYSNVVNNMMNLPTHFLDIPPEYYIHSSDKGNTTAAVDLIFVPAAITDGIMLGYDWAMPAFPQDNPDDKMNSNPFSNPSVAPMLGRYAYDVANRRLTVVLNNISHLATGVITMSWDSENKARSRYFFTVPNEQYSFDYLPNRVIVCLSNLEIKLGSSSFPSSTEPSTMSNSNSDSSIDDNDLFVETKDAINCQSPDGLGTCNPAAYVQKDVNIIPDLLASSADMSFSNDTLLAGISQSELPTMSNIPVSDQIDDTIQAMAENLDYEELPHKKPSQSVVSRRPRSRFDDNSVFNMSTLMECMNDLNSCLAGQYYGPNLKQEVCNPFTGEVAAPAFGQCQANLTTAGKILREKMQQYAAQTYYQAAFSLMSEKWLPAPKKPCREEVGQSQASRQMIAAQAMNMVPLTPQGACISCPNCQTGNNMLVHSQVQARPAVIPPIDENAIKEAKLEAKRRRNRLSAARSNQKRKERMEQKKKELQTLKETEQELRAVEEKLRLQNEGLKKQAATMLV